MEYSDEISRQIEAYLRGTLDGVALQEFESLLKSDAELSNQVKHYKEVVSVLDEETWALSKFDANNDKAKTYLNFYTDKKNQDYFKKLENLDVSENESQNRFNIRSIFGAVGIAAMLVIAFFIYNANSGSTNYNQIADAYINKSEIPSLTVRGSSADIDSITSLIDSNFELGKYEAVNNLIDANQNSFSEETVSLLYLYEGFSYNERQQYEKAQGIFGNKDLFSATVYDQLAEWQLALSFLQSDDIDEAKKLLLKFSKDKSHFKQKEAKEILRKIK